MKAVLQLILVIIIITTNTFAQSTTSSLKNNEQTQPTLEETINWLNEKFKTSLVPILPHEKRCEEGFEVKVNNSEIIAIKRYNCDGVNYEIIYTVPFKLMEPVNTEDRGTGPKAVSALTILLKCAGGNSCISKQRKDYITNTTKTTPASSLDFFSINVKCMNSEIRERIIKAINHAIELNGGGKLNEKF